MKKRLVLLLAVMLVLTGCGNAAVPEESGEISSAAGEVDEVTSEQPEESEEEESEPSGESIEEENESESSEESKEDTSEAGEASGEETEAPEESTASRGRDADTSTASAEEKETPTPTPTPGETAESTPTPTAQTSSQTEGTQVAVQTSAPAAAPTPQPVHTHSWDGGTVTQAATCTAEGVKTYTCTSCGSTKTESVAKTDHNYAWLWPMDEDLGNCQERYRLVDICSDCGYILNTYTDETYESHEWGEVVWGEGSTCTSAVTYTHTCIKCGKVSVGTAGPNGHRLDSIGKCKDCGEHVEHVYVEGECWCGAVQEGYVEASTQATEEATDSIN